MQPTEAVRELAEALSSRVKHQDMAEVFRLASLVETLAEPLAEAGFEPLLIYSRGMGSFARGNLIGAVAQFREALEEGNQIRVAEVSLPIPEQIFEEAEHTSKQALSSSRRINTLKLDLGRFYRACSPSSLDWVNDARKYYIDFSSVRGGNIVEKLRRTITHLSPDEPTCQLFTGNIGCGKSTELRRLEADLKQQDFHVVYFESSQDLDMADVDITDILLAITRAVSESLEASGIRLKSGYFFKLFDEIADILQTPIEFSEAKISLPGCIAEITAKTKDSPKLRNQLRQYLEPRTNNILQLINQEVLGRATQELKAKGKQGLVVLVDNLDRIDTRPKTTGRTQQEYLFLDRGEQLSRLNCHVVYTIPLALIFSNEAEALKNRLGGGRSPNILPMVPVQVRQGSECSEGMALLKQMVLARAFPNVDMVQRLGLITEVFDSPDTLDRLCRVSGGHLRTLLMLLCNCIQQEDPPLSHECIESVIRQRRNELASVIADDEWDLLRQVAQQKTIRAEERYPSLVGSLFIFEYRDFDGVWFDINPILAEVRELYL
jgi:hypothetical protein